MEPPPAATQQDEIFFDLPLPGDDRYKCPRCRQPSYAHPSGLRKHLAAKHPTCHLHLRCRYCFFALDDASPKTIASHLRICGGTALATPPVPVPVPPPLPERPPTTPERPPPTPERTAPATLPQVQPAPLTPPPPPPLNN